ncbi:PKD-like family lipoprotein [Chitinophaga lutea]
MNKYFFAGIVALLLGCAGCYKDKGNYDLHDINKVIFTSTTPDSIKLKMFERLVIKVEVTQTMGVDLSNLSFQWSMYDFPNSTRGNVLLSKTKDLDTVVNVFPGVYKVLLTATDNNTGVAYFKEFSLDYTGLLSEGWLLLEEKGSLRDLHMINPLGEIIRSVYASANNGEALPQGTHQVRVLNTIDEQHVAVLAEHDIEYLSFITFQRQYGTNSLFFEMPGTLRPKSIFYTKLGVNGFLINDKKLQFLSLFESGPRKFGVPIEGDYEISPYGFPLTSDDFTLLYDDQHQRFLRHSGRKVTALISPAGSAFDLANVGKKLVYGGRSLNDFHNCLLKDNEANKFYVYRINTTATLIAAEKYDVLDAPGIERAVAFASSGIYVALYYAVDNKIYMLDILSGKARVVYTFPAGQQVTTIELKQSQFSLLWIVPGDNRELWASTHDGTQGRVYQFPVATTGDFTGGTYSKVYEGFGKIIDLEFKNKR